MKKRPNQVGRPKKSSESSDAEARICAAALDLFAERCFSAVTIKDIAKATGFNTALIYYYFDSKDELVQRAVTLAVEQAFRQFRSSVTLGQDPQKTIEDWLETHVREYATISKLIKISMDYASSAHRASKIDRAIRQFYRQEHEALVSALAAGVRSNTFGDIDPEEVATFISTCLDGIFVRAMILSDFDPIAAIRSLKINVAAQLCRSVPRNSKRAPA